MPTDNTLSLGGERPEPFRQGSATVIGVGRTARAAFPEIASD